MRALPRLLEKVRERGFRVLVRGLSDDRIDLLDESLWTFRADSFLPHARAGDTIDATEQPVLLTTTAEGNANGAPVLVLIEDAPAADIKSFERCLYMFDGNDDLALQAARNRWKALKDNDISVSYFQQTDEGWKKMA
ncbi:MAG: DNA polymerase III subunit chi, partial [Sneathiella sp.]